MMNTSILNQYSIEFRKTSKGFISIKSTNTNYEDLGLFIDLICYNKGISYLLMNINRALNNQYNLVNQVDYDVELGDIVFIGSINDDMTFSVYCSEDNAETGYPLSDVKEILESLIEFIQS